MRLSTHKKAFLAFYLFNLALVLTTASCAGSASGFGADGSSSGGGGGGGPSVASSPSDPGNGSSGGGSNGSPPTMSGTKLIGNPFIGANMYVNPDYAAQVQKTAGATAADAPLLQKAARFPTAVWLDRMAAIAGGAANDGRMSLIGHLDAAVAQAAQSKKPVALTLVIYDLPGRDCAALASNGELPATAAGLQTYKTSYIDPIVAAISKPAYKDLRLVLIVEPDSLPNMATNLSIAQCATVAAGNFYTTGVTYVIQQMGALPNSFLYLDIGHSGWLGWPNNMQKTAKLYVDLIAAATSGKAGMVRGLATDIANYTPLKEPFVNPSNTALLSGPFYESNPVFDESTFTTNLAAAFKTAGYAGDLGFVIDTSRSGWAKIDDGMPIDGRKARGNWCNVQGSGLGERPQAAPAGTQGIDAYLYVKPPGESDGGSTAGTPGYDPKCEPANATNGLDGYAGVPRAGQWFDAGFLQLVRKATPAL